jgi:hypothetical protein
MDRLSDALPSKQPPRTASCPEHGEYQSANLFRNIWSKCPACEAAVREAEDARRVEEARQSAARRHRQMLDTAAIPARSTPSWPTRTPSGTR